ncbi:hypothetical protein MLD38_000231 [Melastoma candidum]|uniref:Uncharacterized protein n=1 Tax=Melastoma candidum TaxID=119954 RepID=A0ACB9S9D0_9MYRT|nr:hypothetical protein MLD38_000231 [Melastoma candidum]
MAARQRPSITQMLSATDNPDNSLTARRSGLPDLKFVFPFDMPASPEALAIRIIKNLSRFCLFYSLLLWAGLTISLVPIRRTSLHILLSMTAVTNSFLILLRLMPQPMFLHRAMDKAAVLLTLGIVTVIALILTGAAMHMFLTSAIGVPVVLVHAAFWKDDLQLGINGGNVEEASVGDFTIALIDGIRSRDIGV